MPLPVFSRFTGLRAGLYPVIEHNPFGESRLMIRKLRIRNFLSFKEAEIELKPRTVLVGPNMSGKTNLIACLRFLTSLTVGSDASGRSGLQQALFNLGGVRELTWKGSNDPTFEIGIIADALSPGEGRLKTYEYEISIAGSFEHQQVVIARESLIVQSDGERRTLFELKAGEGTWYWRNSDGPLRVMPFQSAFEGINLVDFEGTGFRNLLASWRFYDLVPLLMRQENPPTPQRFLQEHGENFSAWLFTLQRYPEEFLHLKQAALDVLPSLSEILFEPTQTASISLGSLEGHLSRPVGIKQMSNGELAFLALVSLIMAPDELAVPLYCVEEPESHLHPHLLESLVELLNQRQQELGARARQIVVTTHSPQLVDWMHIDDLVVVQKVDGATRFVRPSSDQHLRDLVSSRESGLGELWFSGALDRS